MPGPARFRPLQTGDTRNPLDLERYLRELEREVVALRELLTQPKEPLRLSAADLAIIQRELQAGGSAELDLTNLRGIGAESVDARIPRLTSAPDPYTTPYDTYVLVGSPDTIWQIDRTTNPPTATQIAADTPVNMLTTDTNQTPGATVVKTWTAAQVFNGGLTAGAQVRITAGGLDVDAGGVNIDAGGLTVVAGTSDVRGRFKAGAEILLTGVAVIGVADSPYTVPANIFEVLVNTSGGAITINLTAGPATDRYVLVKDGTGNAVANNITIDGGVPNIDGAGTKTINVAYGAMLFKFNNPDWGVYGIVP